jgi:hypothetical protein
VWENKMDNNIVYMHRNKINNKIYIGQTCNIKKRWAVSSYIGSNFFYSALQKYGWDNFDHIILKEKLTPEEADYWEIYFIEKYKTTNSEFGYNISEGGKQKCILKGKNNPFYGKHHSKETLKKLKDKKKGGNNPSAKAVRCLNTNEIFPSCREAADWCYIPRQNINRCCRGGRPTAGKHPVTGEKLKWRYVEDEI